LRKNQTEALELRRGGHSFDEIAAHIKRPRATVHRWVTDALEEMIQEPAQAVLKLELQRLDAYLAAYHAAAVEGDLQATDMALTPKRSSIRTRHRALTMRFVLRRSPPTGDREHWLRRDSEVLVAAATIEAASFLATLTLRRGCGVIIRFDRSGSL
jgi:hypothetical protein